MRHKLWYTKPYFSVFSFLFFFFRYSSRFQCWIWLSWIFILKQMIWMMDKTIYIICYILYFIPRDHVQWYSHVVRKYHVMLITFNWAGFSCFSIFSWRWIQSNFSLHLAQILFKWVTCWICHVIWIMWHCMTFRIRIVIGWSMNVINNWLK